MSRFVPIGCVLARDGGDDIGPVAGIVADEELAEEFEPSDFDGEDPMDAYGYYEAGCAGCDAVTQVDDMMLCDLAAPDNAGISTIGISPRSTPPEAVPDTSPTGSAAQLAIHEIREIEEMG